MALAQTLGGGLGAGGAGVATAEQHHHSSVAERRRGGQLALLPATEQGGGEGAVGGAEGQGQQQGQGGGVDQTVQQYAQRDPGQWCRRSGAPADHRFIGYRRRERSGRNGLWWKRRLLLFQLLHLEHNHGFINALQQGVGEAGAAIKKAAFEDVKE